MDIGKMMQQLANRGTAAGIARNRCFGYPIASPPVGSGSALIVGYPDTINYDAVRGRGRDDVEGAVWLLVGMKHDPRTRDKLTAFAAGSGASSLKTAFETTPEGEGPSAWSTIRIVSAEVEEYTTNAVTYLAYRFNYQISGPGQGA